jgi:hypothetical protein
MPNKQFYPKETLAGLGLLSRVVIPSIVCPLHMIVGFSSSLTTDFSLSTEPTIPLIFLTIVSSIASYHITAESDLDAINDTS